jgi:predicted nucleic acid-binding protein
MHENDIEYRRSHLPAGVAIDGNSGKDATFARRVEGSDCAGKWQTFGTFVGLFAKVEGYPTTLIILVDTSVWVDFLRRGNGRLQDLLLEGEVATHPVIIGELSVGNLSKRAHFLSLLHNLPVVGEASHTEVLDFIEAKKIYGKGVGYMNVSILCSAILSQTPLWSLDKRLDALAPKYR